MPSLDPDDAETAYSRTVLMAVELVDAVTLEPAPRQVQVRATGLASEPVVNASGYRVWLAAGAQRPLRVLVDPGELPYDAEDVDAPVLPPDLGQAPAAQRRLRIVLRPRRGYRFPDGVTVIRGRLVENAAPAPRAVRDAEVWIEWQEESTLAWKEQRARFFTRTRGDGEFVAFLRLLEPDLPLLDAAGAMQVRLAAARPGGAPRHTAARAMRAGQQLDEFQYLTWDVLTT